MILYYAQIDKEMIQNTGLRVAQTQLVSGKLILNYRNLSFSPTSTGCKGEPRCGFAWLRHEGSDQ